ncbi:lysin A [Mycobacterium phage Typha]|uniref:Lysin A n=1 Tax=Mycobacterium phage Typha TaxID=2517971 RepID=A0A482JAE8_9CAUD|nr:endolysin [Mycobacterium phage Typha]QBP29688.1 lysin A [Mycobacterium phage Typha]
MTRFLPLKEGTFRWGSPFGWRPGGDHYGQDFEAADGTPIYAAQAGTVAYIGAASGFGQWIVIDHPAADGAGTTVYGHMWDAFATGLRQGDWVGAGQLIGYVGSNGQSTGPHLHFEVHPTVWRAGSQIDPRPWLSGALNPGGALTPPPSTGGGNLWTGDPVWLEEVLGAELGDRLRTLPGWKNRGHGDFKDIRGVMWHHTGNGRASAESIRDGRPDLAGPLANLHIAQNGIVTIVAVGVCWHAGSGSYPWLPTNMGNWHMIGVECAWPMDTSGRINASYQAERWPDEQIISMRDVAAALSLKLNVGADHNIGHKDYAGATQGKWDPGYLDMRWFQGEVAKDMQGMFGGPVPPPPPPPVVDPPVSNGYAHILIYRGMTGPAVRALQTRLKRAYSKLVVDGDFGPHTEACVRDYQKLHPPLAADGIVGPATAAMLELVI